ncbi:MAG TPA: hypothetical protein VK421_09335 [Pyrinomonadaceae bacterium]|nr:hypothetical protein [Pyrinomonadaceae bacterium]
MSNQLINTISIIGSVLSLIGVIIAIAQIRKTLRAAKAAQAAATQTQIAISRNVLLTDISTCARSLEELKVLIRGNRFEAALMRVTDLTSQLVQLQHLQRPISTIQSIDFKEVLTQLSILRELLERKIYQHQTEINPVLMNSQLSQISDELNRWIGEEKYLVTERGDHG